MTQPLEPTSDPSSSRHKKNSSNDRQLSTEAANALRTVQEGVIKMLAEEGIVTGHYNKGALKGLEKQHIEENPQNVRNKQCMVAYSAHIKRYVPSLL
jgi:hypothetical protein